MYMKYIVYKTNMYSIIACIAFIRYRTGIAFIRYRTGKMSTL